MYSNVWYKRWKHQMYNSSHTLAVRTLLTFPIENECLIKDSTHLTLQQLVRL